jgi:hypothetical protein
MEVDGQRRARPLLLQEKRAIIHGTGGGVGRKAG